METLISCLYLHPHRSSVLEVTMRDGNRSLPPSGFPCSNLLVLEVTMRDGNFSFDADVLEIEFHVLEVTMRDGNYFRQFSKRCSEVLEVTMRDGNRVNSETIQRWRGRFSFRSDYEGWKPISCLIQIPPSLIFVLEVTMRDGNKHRAVWLRIAQRRVLEVTMRDGNSN